MYHAMRKENHIIASIMIPVEGSYFALSDPEGVIAPVACRRIALSA